MSDLPDWMQPKNKKQRQNRRSANAEAQVAQERGGRRQPGSGSSPRARGDVKSDERLIEHKYTDADSFRLDARYLKRLLRDGLDQGREVELIIDFEGHALRFTGTVERRAKRGHG